MSTTDPKSKTENQRDALAESEKKASEKQPRSYDERNETEKKVHINPPDPQSDNAIKGIDPKQ
ncbi:MAG: hypothetical protein ABIS28_05915 [Caldimonas sp.]